MWLPPGVAPDEEGMGGVVEEGVNDASLAEVVGVLEQVDASHPAQEHWYLPAIGVDPVMQGKGHGSVLLEESLKICDRNHVAAYLESSNPAGIPLYERFGFRKISEIQAGSSPIVTPMLREAR